MTDPTRGVRARRVNRGPGSLLLTVLLVLAIVASSALVFTNKVELLKLAVIIALWAAVVAAFVSFIYRRQADVDAAKSRDLKLVYDLQLDREISARREYELSVETQLRRELASEVRAQSSDEVASLRAELAALRANLEILFDTDLGHRPAIETERTTVHTFGDWDGVPDSAAVPERADRSVSLGRVVSSRIDTQVVDEPDPTTEESPIIDVPVEAHPPEFDWAAADEGGAHRRASEREAAAASWQSPPQEGRRRAPEPVPEVRPEPEVRYPWLPRDPAPQVTSQPPPPPVAPAAPPRQEPERVARHTPRESVWQPAASAPEPPAPRSQPPREPEPVSPVLAPAAASAATSAENGAASPATAQPSVPPAMMAPPAEPVRGRHWTPPGQEPEPDRRARHISGDDPARRSTPPTLAPPAPPPPAPPLSPPMPVVPDQPRARHRGADEPAESDGQHAGGQPLSDLLARLQANATGGGGRRRREE